MRIAGAEVQGFRGFGRSEYFDLDADAVIVAAPNGTGKTSLFDAILWAISGQVPRLGTSGRSLISLYSETGEARVTVTLKASDGKHLQITRKVLGDDHQLRIEFDGEVVQERVAAQSKVLNLLWPAALLTADGASALTSVLVRGVYLQQDLVRQFVDAEREEERFRALSELVGAGRVTELQLQLERAKTAWSRATNDRVREGDQVRKRLLMLEARLAESEQASAVSEQEVGSRWQAWWVKSSQFGVSTVQPPTINSPDAAAALDIAIKELNALRRGNERRREAISALISDITARPTTPVPDLASVRATCEAAEQQMRLAQSELTRAETEAAREREAQIQLRESWEEMRALAGIALRHLGDRCPVCDQAYDHQRTQHRLQEILGTTVLPTEQPRANEIVQLAAKVTESQRILSEAREKLRDAEEMTRQEKVWTARVDRACAELGIKIGPGPELIGTLHRAAERLATLTNTLLQHERDGEAIALGLAQVAQVARRAELQRELTSVRAQVEELDRWAEERTKTGDLAAQMLEGLREAAFDIVAFRLQKVEPLLQRIYAAVDPHPSLSVVKLLTRISRGHGRLAPAVFDPATEVSSECPAIVLSSSQMNALAVCIFLAFNLGIPRLPLDAAILDDPLQSFDDVNLLGFVDQLRRTKDLRQLLISTHSSDFGALLERKLRPVTPGQRTRVVLLESWTRQGPVVYQRDVRAEDLGLRIVA